jgi:hypothetical protein
MRQTAGDQIVELIVRLIDNRIQYQADPHSNVKIAGEIIGENLADMIDAELGAKADLPDLNDS